MQPHIQHVLALLRSHGPATAFAYIQEQGIDTFPPTLVATVRESIVLIVQHRQLQRSSARRRLRVDYTLYPRQHHRARQYAVR